MAVLPCLPSRSSSSCWHRLQQRLQPQHRGLVAVATVPVSSTTSSSTTTTRWGNNHQWAHYSYQHRYYSGGCGGRGDTQSRGRSAPMGGRGGRGLSGREGRGFPGEGRARGGTPMEGRGANTIEVKERVHLTNSGIAVAKKTKGTSGVCYGCGAELVGTNTVQQKTGQPTQSGSMHVTTKKGGYWNEKKELLRISKLKNWGLCDRCKKLKHGQHLDSNDDAILALAPNSHMTQVFREQVSKIKQLPNAVVVLCLDATNWTGTYVGTIRNYVGGNPILLAITRCDLLPEYLIPRGRSKLDQHLALKDFYQTYSRGIHPADAYLCSSSEESSAALYDDSDFEDDEDFEFDGDFDLHDDDDEPRSRKRGTRNRRSKNYDDYSDDDEDDDFRRSGRKSNNSEPSVLFKGMQELANDLDKHLHERDPYIVGAANIGKSTLTDHLITDFLKRGLQERDNDPPDRYDPGRRRRHVRKRSTFSRLDRLTQKRIEKLRESRVTKSSLPGTTLQNIRIPCFVYNHEQALWDTPGLLLDESLAHFPIKNLARIRALRPEPIESVELTIDSDQYKSFALIIYEHDDEDELPLLRIHVRRKKGDTAGVEVKPVRLIWNSILSRLVLAIKVVSIEDALEDEKQRQEQIKTQNKENHHQHEHDEEREKFSESLTKEDRAKRKEERKRAYQERIKQEMQELGAAEWNRREKLRLAGEEQMQRLKKLSELELVHTHVNEPNVGMDIAVANMGWFGVLPPCTTMFQVFAPSSGVRVDTNPTIGLPPSWGKYKKTSFVDSDKNMRVDSDHGDNDDDGEVPELWDDDEVYVDDGDYYEGDWSGSPSDFWGDNDEFGNSRFESDDRAIGKSFNDPWEKYSGKYIGWEYDDKTRFSKNRMVDGWYPIREDKSQN